MKAFSECSLNVFLGNITFSRESSVIHHLGKATPATLVLQGAARRVKLDAFDMRATLASRWHRFLASKR